MTRLGNSQPEVLFVLMFYVTHVIMAQTNIKTAWLCTKAPVFIGFSASNQLGALSYSLETIANDTSLLSGYSFDVRYIDSACSSKNSLGGLVDLIESGFNPDLVVGPLCTPAMLSSGLLGADLNIPTFGWISSDPPVQDKTQYSTLVRLLWPTSNIGQGILLLMQKLNWRRAFLISTEGGDYGELARGVRDVITGAGADFTITNWERDVQLNASQAVITEIYRQVKEEARIVILSVPLDRIRHWMLGVYSEEMYSGDYVFIYVNQQTVTPSLLSDVTDINFWQTGDGNDANVRQAYENLFLVLAKGNPDSRVEQFLSEFNTSAWSSGLASQLNLTPTDPDFYSMFLFDSMMLYARVASEVLTDGGSLSNGTALLNKARSSLTKGGATGDIIMDDNADRIPDYWLFDLQADGRFQVGAETFTTEQGSAFSREWSFILEPRWGDGTIGVDNAPPDEPLCGFDNEKCPPTTVYIAVGVTLGVLLVICVIAFLVFRKVQYERQLNDMAWKVNYEDVAIYSGMKAGFGSMANVSAASRLTTNTQDSKDSVGGQVFITVANYKGNMVAVKNINKRKVDINRLFLQEMKQMVDLKHLNLNPFIGVCVDPPNICALWEYCSKGSLQDVIANDAINLDAMLKFAISIDLLKGLQFLHESPFEYHGHLRSSNVVIDGRWVCKLTDFGLTQLLQGAETHEETSTHNKYSSLYWTAPELLQTLNQLDMASSTRHQLVGSQQADLYAVAVILKEIFCRNEPYDEYEELDPQDIITKVKDQNGEFRPSLAELNHADISEKTRNSLCACITTCWSENPKDRETAPSLLKKLAKINPSKKSNVMDNMLAIMEQYSAQLEVKVAAETESLVTEKQKTEQLLLKMLPRSVAEDLKQGKSVEAESFECVTIYFSDIPGFSDFAASSTPVQVVDLLNSVYSLMDDIIAQYDVYKVETVGDVYVLVSGLPQRNGDRHIVEICDCALDLLSEVTTTLATHSNNNYKARLRIGIHTGPIVAGVIGLAMPRYCLFGDTINTSSRMESTGAAMRIHLSPYAFEALSQFSGYKLSDRGTIPVKGKGDMNTYWLTGREDFQKPLPDFDQMFKQDTKQPVPLPPTRGKPRPKRLLRPSVESGFSERLLGSPQNSASNLGVGEKRATSLEDPTRIYEEPNDTLGENNAERNASTSGDPSKIDVETKDTSGGNLDVAQGVSLSGMNHDDSTTEKKRKYGTVEYKQV